MQNAGLLMQQGGIQQMNILAPSSNEPALK